ncbi:hypothetical protein OG455_10860 [Kitasatospora sp. NBC_01287]|uniref:hypothetical protein n=1 Tax=Kitasatospora sp. NBC_01287 TaxID=2903573 RepID=UPI00224DA755|nr:hypothetical protein [Kitasatospora sp. NBC_01287]MCX4746018.1 hypothetical protein [Kitasatospora sp. NBC_01287]
MSEPPLAPPAPPAPEAVSPWEPEPEPLGVPLDPTGHPGVDAALDRLAVLDGVPTTEHAAVYEDVHETLSTILTTLDDS